MVEDALSEASTPCDTPLLRSRANSGAAVEGCGHQDMTADDAFANFSYTQPSFEVSVEQVERFQAVLTEKLAKAAQEKG